MSNNQANYETLPELLNDLSIMVQKIPSTLPNLWNSVRWTAVIDCGGDYHNLYFSTGGRNHAPDDKIDHVYEDFDSLYTELEYIQEFLSTQEIGNYNLTYDINSNGGKPFLRVNLVGIRDQCFQKEDHQSPLCQLLPEVGEVRGYLLTAAVLPLAIIPSIYLVDKLMRN